MELRAVADTPIYVEHVYGPNLINIQITLTSRANGVMRPIRKRVSSALRFLHTSDPLHNPTGLRVVANTPMSAEHAQRCSLHSTRDMSISIAEDATQPIRKRVSGVIRSLPASDQPFRLMVHQAAVSMPMSVENAPRRSLHSIRGM